MILIADAGATKIQWIVINERKVSEPIETTGFNPYFMDPGILKDGVEKGLVPFIDQRYINDVYYYGAGCSTQAKCGIVEDVLRDIFDRADFEIYHDLLGAARALLKHQEGIACILGTGSNSCLFDGKNILENVTSLGYLFGDEGSGAYIGKLLLTAYLRKTMPEHIRHDFDKRYGYSVENILDSVYGKSHPNRFLSSFALFASNHLDDPFIRDIIRQNFRDFFRDQVTQYTHFKEKQLGVVGSVGFHFQDLFRETAEEYGMKVSKFIKSPIEGLAEYHNV
jgi:N-acetylglucosamine kinase-like BadF-type ATPase